MRSSRFNFVSFAAQATLIAGCSSAASPAVLTDAATDATAEASSETSTETSSDATPDTATDGAAETLATADAAATAYPSGPYGVTVGAVIANFTWTGYADPAADAIATTKSYGAYSLDDARKSGKRYAMINLAEKYCPGCQKSAGEFATDGAGVVAAGGVAIEVLETSGFFSQASKGDLDAWVNKYNLSITTVKDTDGSGTPTLTALGPREQAYIVDLSTMKIVEIIAGDITGAGATSGGLAMAEMHKLLGK